MSSGAAGFIILYFIFVLSVAVFMIASVWRVFTKAGEKGWKCLIPFYGSYVEWRIGWDSEKFIQLFVGSIVVNVVATVLTRLGNAGIVIAGIASLGWGVFAIVRSFQFAIRLAHRFGKSTGFGVAAIALFPFVGYPMLAWGSADYNADRDLGDGRLRSDSELRHDSEESSDYWNRISNS